jgi:hypothetical protein
LNLEYESLNKQLREQLPELGEPRYAQLIGGIEAGPYVVFGVLFNQYLIDMSQANDGEAKAKASSFIEEMAVAKDERVSDMLVSEVLPTLVKSQAMVDAYWPLLGVATQRRMSLLPSRIVARVELPSQQ